MSINENEQITLGSILRRSGKLFDKQYSKYLKDRGAE